MKHFSLALCVFAFTFTTGVASAQNAPATLDPKIQERLASEKEARKQCKTDICKVFAGKEGGSGDIQCDAVKTWLDADISGAILSGNVGWPWGHAQCSAHIDMDRAALAKAVSEPEATIKLKQHTLKCLVDKKGGEGKEADSYVVKFSVAPEVTFKKGKATAVKLNWSDVSAPTLLQGAVWSATTLDKTFDILGSKAAAQINDFIYGRCKEVGVEIAEKK
jgi:hypothetical protein